MHLFTYTIRFEKSYVTCKCEKKSPSRDAAGKIYAIKAISDETIKTLFFVCFDAHTEIVQTADQKNVQLLTSVC